MKYYDYVDLTMDWVIEALKRRPVPESVAPHLDADEDELDRIWLELGKANDSIEDSPE